MIQPAFLKKGDKVIIVAPAKRLQSGLDSAIEVLTNLGLRVEIGDSVFKESNLFAGTDKERRNDLQQALDDSEAKAIIMARGGYGTTRILDHLDFEGFKKYPKWVCGFSDITVLLQRLSNLDFCSLHSTVAVLMGRQEHEDSDEYLRKALFGEGLAYRFESKWKNQIGSAEGEVCGGNLSMICNSIGTSSEIETAGRILIIEEVGEYIYHLDRMLVQLKRAGKFDQLKGLIVGHFTSMKDHSDTFGIDGMGVIADQLMEYSFPIAYGFPSGHEAPNLAYYIGQNANLIVKEKSASLDYESGQQPS